MKTMLFPTDFSDRANRALIEVGAFAKEFKTKIIVYHVYHQPFIKTDLSIHMAGLLENVERCLDKTFNNFLQENPEFETIDYEFRKERGLSVEKIIQTVQNGDIDLICMATKGAQSFGELWGTKTAKIVKSVNVPTLVIPDNTNLTEMGKVGLICDYSQKADYHSLDFLSSIIDNLNLEADVITLNCDERNMTGSEKAYLQLVRKKLKNVPTTFHFVSDNDVERGVIEYCKKNDIGLVAILHKKYNFLVELFHESLTKKMTFRSHIPLLVLK
ncbi:MAG: universal stress protein [Fulvivirga sp.]